MAFLFPDDIFGIAEAGHYVNTLQAITAVTLYRFDRETLVATLRRDPELQFQFLCKATHELRQSFRRSMVVGRRDAVGRVAMFLYMLERESKAPHGGIEIPMSRSDAANYLGLSLEAVSRAAGSLQRRGIVQFSGRHIAHVINRPEFDQLVTSL
jgi:CRP/FNR family transcriptional regulator